MIYAIAIIIIAMIFIHYLIFKRRVREVGNHALAALYAQGKMDSVSLKRYISDRIGDFSVGLFYVAMNILEECGWVTRSHTEKVFPERGDRPRVIFELTIDGRIEVQYSQIK